MGKKRFCPNHPGASLFCLALSCLCMILSSAAATAREAADFSEIAARVRPSVVTVITYDYDGRIKSLGSGYFYNPRGDIITNSHVVEKNKRTRIKTHDGTQYTLEAIIERSETRDFLKAGTGCAGANLPWIEPASTLPRVGDKVMVIGSPLGLDQTVSEGIVSAWREIPKYGKVIQISAPVSPGSSGGPVIDMNGRVVGIAAFQAVNGQNLNFAIPIDTILPRKQHSQGKAKGSNCLKFHKNSSGTIVIE